MPMVDFSDKDLLRSKIVPPAWYRVRIETTGEAPSSKGDSTNYLLEGTILHDADTGNTDLNGVPTPYWNFNSKAKGFMVGFFQALGVDIVAGQRYELKHAEGKEIDVFIENDTWEGRVVNRINHKYRTPR
jgi:hypothetical protein